MPPKSTRGWIASRRRCENSSVADQNPYTLRALSVECHAGYRGEEEPRALTLDGRRLAVAEILDRWLAPTALPQAPVIPELDDYSYEVKTWP